MTAVDAAAAQAGVENDLYGGMTPIMQKQVQALVAASHGKVRLVSGYRSPEQQQALVDQAGKLYGAANTQQWAANPADSNHTQGQAADFAGDLTVLHQLAPQFGLQAPMSWEPWHLEMPSTTESASPNAYTLPPAGEVNPVTKIQTAKTPAQMAATLSESLQALQHQQNALGTAEQTLDATNAAAPAAAPQGPSSDTTSLGGANVPGGKGNVSPQELYGALTSAGIDPTHAAALVAIAGRESGYNTGAHNGNASTGDDSYGLFQINLLNGGWGPFLEQHGIADPAQALTTLQGSVQAAKAILGSSGLHPWGGYKGLPWWYNTNLQNGVDASGGQVTAAQLQALGGG